MEENTKWVIEELINASMRIYRIKHVDLKNSYSIRQANTEALYIFIDDKGFINFLKTIKPDYSDEVDRSIFPYITKEHSSKQNVT